MSADSAKSKQFYYPRSINVVVCNLDLEPDPTNGQTVLTSNLNTHFMLNTATDRYGLVIGVVGTPVTKQMNGYVFCPYCGHSYCNDETLSGIT